MQPHRQHGHLVHGLGGTALGAALGAAAYFVVDDAVKAEAAVLERGGSAVEKVVPAAWGNMGVVADPWGAHFGIGDSLQA